MMWAIEDELISDVLWTDEASVMMECHRRLSWHKHGTQPKPKPRCVLHVRNSC